MRVSLEFVLSVQELGFRKASILDLRSFCRNDAVAATLRD